MMFNLFLQKPSDNKKFYLSPFLFTDETIFKANNEKLLVHLSLIFYSYLFLYHDYIFNMASEMMLRNQEKITKLRKNSILNRAFQLYLFKYIMRIYFIVTNR
jgi:hypothetical protein